MSRFHTTETPRLHTITVPVSVVTEFSGDQETLRKDLRGRVNSAMTPCSALYEGSWDISRVWPIWNEDERRLGCGVDLALAVVATNPTAAENAAIALSEKALAEVTFRGGKMEGIGVMAHTAKPPQPLKHYDVTLLLEMQVWGEKGNDAAKRAVDHIFFPDEEVARSVQIHDIGAEAGSEGVEQMVSVTLGIKVWGTSEDDAERRAKHHCNFTEDPAVSAVAIHESTAVAGNPGPGGRVEAPSEGMSVAP